MMEQEFSISKGWKLFTFIFSIAFIAAMLFFLAGALASGKEIAFWLCLNVGSILLFGYCIISAYRKKTVLTKDEIVQYGTFNKKQLFFREVKGIRVSPRNVIIVSNDSFKSNLIISDYSYLTDNEELLRFLKHNFVDLDESDYNTELTEALHDTAIGTDIKDRERRLNNAKKVSGILNIGGLIITFWLFIYPHPYVLSLSIGLLYPIIATIYFFRQQEVLTLFDAEKKSAYPSLNTALFLPPAGLIVRALVQYDLLSFKDCILPIILSSIAFTLMFLLFLRESKTKSNNFWMGVIFSLIFSSGGIVIVNCAFDGSKPTEYKTRVLDQSITSGKSTTYYLKLDTWGARKESEDESVPKSVYYSIKKGDWVTVYVKKGRLNIPWYFVDK